LNFEFDPDKSRANKDKHGIDFEEAQALWLPGNEVFELPLKNYLEEERYLCIGMINKKLWSVVITYRSENIRVISARRARKDERELYGKRQEINNR